VDLGAGREEKLWRERADLGRAEAPIWVASNWRRRCGEAGELGGGDALHLGGVEPGDGGGVSEERLVVESAPSWVAVKPPI